MNIFITGGTTGIGLNLAKQYASKGHQVGICGRDLSKLPNNFKATHPNIDCYEADVSSELLQEKIHEFTDKNGGKLDIVIANAGISVGNKQAIPNFKTGRDVINTNVLGVMNTFEAALDHMIPKRSGQLVAIASVAGFVGLPGASFYSASKAAVIKLCESFSIDLKKSGISVTTICPGFIDTPLTRKNNHSMPFLMDVKTGARKIKKAIDKKKALYIFPWQMKFIILLLEKMPRSLYRRLLGSRLYKIRGDKL